MCSCLKQTRNFAIVDLIEKFLSRKGDFALGQRDDLKKKRKPDARTPYTTLWLKLALALKILFILEILIGL